MRDLERAALAGLAGSAAMTATTAVEMRLRGRPASIAPVQAAERATGITLPSDRVRRALSWAGHWPFGVGVGLLRPVLGGPGRLFAVGWLPDLVLVPALGQAEPPWRWGAGELGLSALHHAAFALAGEAAWRATGDS